MNLKSIFLFLILLSEQRLLCQTYEQVVDEHQKRVQMKMDSLGPSELDDFMGVELPRLQKSLIGIEFPFFRATDTKGKFYSLDKLKGKVVLINTWFVGCQPCEVEVSTFNELTNEFDKEGFIILSFGRDDEESVQEFLKEHPMKYPVFPNAEDLIQKGFKLSTGYPTNILLDREGRIVYYQLVDRQRSPALKK